MRSVAPITPKEANLKFNSTIPDFVIAAFNELVAEKYRRFASIEISHNDAVERILKLAPDNTERHTVIDSGWLDIETLYAEFGWKVVYHKQCIGDTKPSYFTFKVM